MGVRKDSGSQGASGKLPRARGSIRGARSSHCIRRHSNDARLGHDRAELTSRFNPVQAVYENDSVANYIQQQDTPCHWKLTTMNSFRAHHALALYSVAPPNRDLNRDCTGGPPRGMLKRRLVPFTSSLESHRSGFPRGRCYLPGLCPVHQKRSRGYSQLDWVVSIRGSASF